MQLWSLLVSDDSRASGEGWFEFIQRWRTPLAGHTGYHQYFYPTAFPHNQAPHPAPNQHQSGGHVTENIGRGRPDHAPDPGLRHGLPPDAGHGEAHGRAGGEPSHANVVQIKPEPSDYDRLQQDIRHERNQQGLFGQEQGLAGAPRRTSTSLEYPTIADSIASMDHNRRDRLPLPMDYPAHLERLRMNHDNNHDPLPPEFPTNVNPEHRSKDGGPPHLDRPLGGVNLESRDTDLEPGGTLLRGFHKITTNSSGMLMPSRQTANRCPVCNRIFHYYSSFNRHMKLHQGVFTHICEVCRRKFTRKEHFVRHKCHRRPNKPSRMADLNEGDSSLGSGGVGDPLVQPPPTSNEPSPREMSIPPPLIHISQMADTITTSSERNAFTYEPHVPPHVPPHHPQHAVYPEASSVTTSQATAAAAAAAAALPMDLGGFIAGGESERPPPLLIETSNKHRRKTTTPMKVEAFMEPPPSLDTPVETPTGRSPVEMSDVFDKHPLEYPGERPVTSYRRASSSDLGKISSSAAEFNISRPQSRNSEPARSSSSQYGPFDQQPLQDMAAAPVSASSTPPEDKQQQQSYSGKSTPTPTGTSGLREDQYPVLKRKVLEAASSLSHLDSSNNNYTEGAEDDDGEGVVGAGDRGYRAGSRDDGGSDTLLEGDSYQGYGDEPMETMPTDLSATGTPTGGQSSQDPSSPSGHDTASIPTPTCAAPTTPTSDATPSSAAAMSPYGSQSGEGPLGDVPYEQHISPPGPQRDSTSLSLNTSLSLPSAYATSEPSSPAARQQGDIHCQACNKRFLHLSSLNRHMKLHQGVFSHACAVCQRKFTRKEHFVNHKCSRRPRNPTRVMEPDSPHGQSPHGTPQKVEFPPSMTLPKQPSPPSAAWNAGPFGMSGPGGLGGPVLPQPGPSMTGDGDSPTLPPSSSPDQRRLWKLKSKWK